MKNILLNFILCIAYIAQCNSQTSQRYATLQNYYNEATFVFEGILVKSNHSYYNFKKEIETSFEIKVIREIKGKLTSLIIVFEGGSINDSVTGITKESRSSHSSNGPPLGKTLYFIRSTGDKTYRAFHMLAFENPTTIISNPQYYGPKPYSNLKEYYSDLSKITGKKLKFQ